MAILKLLWLFLAIGAEGSNVTALKKNAAEDEKESLENGAVLLLGGLLFLTVVFCMVNIKHKTFRDTTWSMITGVTSILVAVMTYNFVKKFIEAIAKGTSTSAEGAGMSQTSSFAKAFIFPEGEHHDTPANVIVAFAYVFFWWFLCILVLYIVKESALRLKGYGTIFGHIMGFAVIGAYAEGLAETKTFHTNQWYILAVIGIYIVTIPLVVLPTALLGKLCKSDKLHEQSVDTAQDMFCMGLAFLLAMFFRSCVKDGKHAAGAEAEGEHSHWQIGQLILIGFVGLLLATVFHYCQHRVSKEKAKADARTAYRQPEEEDEDGEDEDEDEDEDKKKPNNTKKKALVTLFEVLATVTAITTAFCFLGAAQWYFLQRIAPEPVKSGEEAEGLVKGVRTPSGEFMAHVMVAVFFSIVFVIAVTLLFTCTHFLKVSKSVLKGTFLAVSLVVGLSWEHLFDVALEMCGKFAKHEQGQRWLTVALTFVLIIVIFPVWMAFMLPKHDEELKEEYKNKDVSLFASCGDCFSDDEGDDEDDLKGDPQQQGYSQGPTM